MAEIKVFGYANRISVKPGSEYALILTKVEAYRPIVSWPGGKWVSTRRRARQRLITRPDETDVPALSSSWAVGGSVALFTGSTRTF